MIRKQHFTPRAPRRPGGPPPKRTRRPRPPPSSPPTSRRPATTAAPARPRRRRRRRRGRHEAREVLLAEALLAVERDVEAVGARREADRGAPARRREHAGRVDVVAVVRRRQRVGQVRVVDAVVEVGVEDDAVRRAGEAPPRVVPRQAHAPVRHADAGRGAEQQQRAPHGCPVPTRHAAPVRLFSGLQEFKMAAS